MSEQPEQFEEEEELNILVQARQLSAAHEISRLLHPEDESCEL
jgi:hypothetical protein